LIISCFIGVVAISGNAKIPYQEVKVYSGSWMNNITDDTYVQDIVIPGSHDSGTYNMNWTSETQTYTVKEQLATGVRYLDLRVNKKSDNQYVIYHGPTNGVNFLSILKDIKDFILTNPSETILLDFQHFKNNSEKDVYDLLTFELYEDNLLVENTSSMPDLEFVATLKLKEARGKCIAFFGEVEKNVVDNSPYIFLRNDNLSTFKK
jgi:Phosphatidylinositol-specific phospholipase C, X domain.